MLDACSTDDLRLLQRSSSSISEIGLHHKTVFANKFPNTITYKQYAPRGDRTTPRTEYRASIFFSIILFYHRRNMNLRKAWKMIFFFLSTPITSSNFVFTFAACSVEFLPSSLPYLLLKNRFRTRQNNKANTVYNATVSLFPVHPRLSSGQGENDNAKSEQSNRNDGASAAFVCPLSFGRDCQWLL